MLDIVLLMQWVIIPLFLLWPFTQNFKNSFYVSSHQRHFRQKGFRAASHANGAIEVRIPDSNTVDQHNANFARTLRSWHARFTFWLIHLIVFEIVICAGTIGVQFLLQ